MNDNEHDFMIQQIENKPNIVLFYLQLVNRNWMGNGPWRFFSSVCLGYHKLHLIYICQFLPNFPTKVCKKSKASNNLVKTLRLRNILTNVHLKPLDQIIFSSTFGMVAYMYL